METNFDIGYGGRAEIIASTAGQILSLVHCYDPLGFNDLENQNQEFLNEQGFDSSFINNL